MSEKFTSGVTSIAQYSLWQILGIWALAAFPMGLLAWVVFPALVSHVRIEPGIFLWILMIAGLSWQVALSAILIYREHGTLRPSVVRRRTWRQRPRNPRSGQPRPVLWLWLIPALLLYAGLALILAYPSRRFRCAWFGLIVHRADGIFFIFIILSLVLGFS